MTLPINQVKQFLDRHDPQYDLDSVTRGNYGNGVMTKFWPYKLAGLLIFGETPGVRKLPGHLILAPMPVLAKICPAPDMDRVRQHLASAVDAGLFDSVEFYSNHALIAVPYTAWELGVLDIDGKFAEFESPLVRKPLVSPPAPPKAPKPRKVGRPREWVHVSELPEEYR